MSRGALTVDRLTATVRVDSLQDGAGRRVDTLLREIADVRLPRAWAGISLPPGHWCLRRLDLAVDLELGRGHLTLGERWARALVARIELALRQGTDVVHYRHELDALVDAVASLAMGRANRAWAWARLGVLPPNGPDPATAPGPAVLAALLHRSELIVPALTSAAGRLGLAALDRTVGAQGWRRLARRAWEAAGGRLPTGAVPAASGPPPRPTMLAASELVVAIRAGRIAPPAPVLDAWATLVALELDPVLPTRTIAEARLGEVRAAVAATTPSSRRSTFTSPPRLPAEPPLHDAGTGAESASPAPAGGRGTPPPAVVARPTASLRLPTGGASPPPIPAAAPVPRASVPLATAPPESVPPAPGAFPSARPGAGAPQAATPARAGRRYIERPASRSAGRPSGWAGLPFLLATAAAVGLPDRLLQDPDVAARPLAWCLHAVGHAITGAAADDPGLLALAGLHGRRAAAVVSAPPPGDAERTVVNAVARDWAAVTAARLMVASPDPAADGLGPGTDPRDAVIRVGRRPGQVIAEPGWIEVHLPLDGVDLAIRRAGLDIDPGWVGWLGTVVRYIYA
jgi:hypothetical protein